VACARCCSHGVNCAKTAISLFSTGASGCGHCEPVLKAVAKQWPMREAECVCAVTSSVLWLCCAAPDA